MSFFIQYYILLKNDSLLPILRFPGYFETPLFWTFFHFPWDFEIVGFNCSLKVLLKIKFGQKKHTIIFIIFFFKFYLYHSATSKLNIYTKFKWMRQGSPWKPIRLMWKKTTFHKISVTYRKLNRKKVDKINAQVQNRKSNSEKK